MSDRAAVVIGVNTTGKLTPLKSAVSEAKRVAGFLEEEGFDVALLTDEQKPVRARDIEDAIERVVKPPTRYRMLVVYFSGHGYWHARSDLWLLSEAPQRTGEAINLSGAVDLAKYSGIPNVVFVSDACRSLPTDLAGATINGQYGFPFFEDVTAASKVDVFRATSPARAAYEAKIGGTHQSVLTSALLSAYDNPPETMTRKINVAGLDVTVVPNRLLEGFLQGKVEDLLADIDMNLTQLIESDVPSGDDIYIARARKKQLGTGSKSLADGKLPVGAKSLAGAKRPKAQRRRAKPVGKLAAEIVRQSLAGSAPRRSVLENKGIRKAVRETLGAEIAANMPTDAVTHFESGCGFAVFGAAVSRASAPSKQGRVELLDPGSGTDRPAVLRVWTARPGASVAVELADGRSLALAALEGYIGHCTVTEPGLTNVSYVPSNNSQRWQDYELQRERLDRLRAKVAVAANHSRFSLGSADEARRFADEVRVGKAIDPTLGLYAAYAYSQAGDDAEVRGMLDYMRDDLGADLFDVRMLAFRKPPDDSRPIRPFCPMLTQGWNLLGPRRVTLPKVFDGAGAHLTGSLWTTFQPGFAQELFNAVETGEV